MPSPQPLTSTSLTGHTANRRAGGYEYGQLWWKNRPVFEPKPRELIGRDELEPAIEQSRIPGDV